MNLNALDFRDLLEQIDKEIGVKHYSHVINKYDEIEIRYSSFELQATIYISIVEQNVRIAFEDSKTTQLSAEKLKYFGDKLETISNIYKNLIDLDPIVSYLFSLNKLTYGAIKYEWKFERTEKSINYYILYVGNKESDHIKFEVQYNTLTKYQSYKIKLSEKFFDSDLILESSKVITKLNKIMRNEDVKY